MDFFDGKKFTDFKPEILDLENLGELLARINNLNFKTKANYDPWITMNLGTEFESKSRYLSEGEMKLIEPVVADFLRVDYKKLTKGVVHFDLHRENALKDSNGKYCILDLASVDYNYTIFDLATFIALFCFDPNNDQVENLKNIYKKVVEKYKSIRPINEYELSVLPLLIRSTYAANLLISSYVQNANMDENPEQTVYYKSLGNKGLKMMLDLNL